MFERMEAYLEQSLSLHAPLALGQFRSAQTRITEGGGESRAQALTSCRRMLKSLADAVQPGSKTPVVGADGVERSMDDDHYRNRLEHDVREQLGASKHAKVVAEAIRALGSRMKALDDLASKGVHGQVNEAEAESALASAFMVAADVLRIADGTSHLLTVTPETSTP